MLMESICLSYTLIEMLNICYSKYNFKKTKLKYHLAQQQQLKKTSSRLTYEKKTILFSFQCKIKKNIHFISI